MTVGEGDGVGEGETLGEGEALGRGDGETLGEGLGVAVGVGVGVGDKTPSTSFPPQPASVVTQSRVSEHAAKPIPRKADGKKYVFIKNPLWRNKMLERYAPEAQTEKADQRTSINSTSKRSVAPPGMGP